MQIASESVKMPLAWTPLIRTSRYVLVMCASCTYLTENFAHYFWWSQTDWTFFVGLLVTTSWIANTPFDIGPINWVTFIMWKTKPWIPVYLVVINHSWSCSTTLLISCIALISLIAQISSWKYGTPDAIYYNHPHAQAKKKNVVLPPATDPSPKMHPTFVRLSVFSPFFEGKCGKFTQILCFGSKKNLTDWNSTWGQRTIFFFWPYTKTE